MSTDSTRNLHDGFVILPVKLLTQQFIANPNFTVKAISAVMQIELREQLATGAWQQFNLRTGQLMSVGSPATASAQNIGAIEVDLVQVDGTGRDTFVGSYQLRPGASVDVSAVPGALGRYSQVRFKVLRGSVPVTVSGRTRSLKSGERATKLVDRISLVRPLPMR